MKILILLQIAWFITGTVWVLLKLGYQFSFSDTYNTLYNQSIGRYKGELFAYWLYLWLLPTYIYVGDSLLLALAVTIEVIVGIAPAREYGNKTKLLHNVASVLGIVLAVIAVGQMMGGSMIIVWPVIILIISLALYYGMARYHRIFWIEFTCAICGVYGPLLFII